MALKPIILIVPTTLSGQIATFRLTGADIPATLMANDLDGSEAIDVFRVTDGGPSGENIFQNGVQVEITATNNIITINSPMTVGVQKSVTANAVGVFLSTQGFA